MKKNSITKTFAAQTVLTLILAIFTSIGAWAGDITYTATSGTNGYSFENYGNLVDGDKSSKWCVNSGSPYIEFYSSSPIIPTGYVMTTAADTYPDNLGRNPKRLVIKAKANGSDSWTTLTDVTNDDLVPFKNTTDCTYKLSNTNTYQYFRLEFTSRNNTELQLAEFAFLIAPENVSVSSTTTTMTNGTYQVDSNVTISERIQISGTVNLILGEGATLTANDGIEVPTGATLIIDGTGSLVAQASNNDVEGNGQAGIGARVSFGNIIINGGNVTAKGKNGGAGIGGNRHASSGGDIIINGGVVNATGSTYFISTYDKRYGAGIGGGATNWGGNYGYFKSVIINGGQVTADRIGNSGNNPNGSFGTLVMGWTNYTDFIKADTYSATTMSFAEGKLFMLDGTTTIATTSNINGKKIVPLRYSIADATVSGISSTYNYTGSPININYTVTYNDNTLSAGTDYTATITKDGVNVTEVKDAGNYTLTLTGKDLYMNTKSVNFSVVALSLTNASISGIEPTYYYTDTPINLSYTVTQGGTTLTKGTDYTAKITKGTGNTEVTSITEAGSYILTITGISNYTGSLAQGFEVIAIPELISGGFIVDSGQKTDWSSSEGPSSLVDGNLKTKYGLGNNVTGTPWVEFHYSYPIPVKGYVLWTANDQEGKRNPRSWTIKAKNEGDTGWTTLATVSNSNGDKLPMANETATLFYVNNSNSYQYFRFEATKASNGEFQLAELQFYTTTRVFRDFLYLTIDGIAKRYNYTGSAININHTVTSIEGDILTLGTDYEVTCTRGGNIVQEVKDKGTYTMTFTGIGKYTGTKSLSFNVEDYIEIGNANSSISDCPTDVQNKYSLSQQIYTTTELGDAKTIKSIGFYNTKQGCSRNLEIYMTLTDRSSYNIDSGEYYVEEWVPVDTVEDLVFRGNVTFLKDDWTEIPLDMPFVYDGQHNVAIMIYDKTAVENSSSLNFRAYSVDTYQSADASSTYPEYNPKRPANGHGTQQKNQLLLSIDDLPTSFKPHDIAIDYTGGKTASLSWANGSEGQTAWQICINDGKSDRIIDVTTNPYTLTGLEFATSYAIKMRTNCGNGNYSDWTNVINFATDFCERENMCNISFDLTNSSGYLWLGNAIEVVDAQTGFLLGTVTNDSQVSDDIFYTPITTHEVVLVPAGREINFRWVLGDSPNYCSWTVYDVNGDEIFSGAGNYNMNTGTILYTYTVDCTSNPYKMPTELTCTKVTGTTATLNWTEKGSATAWQICLNDDENNLINVSAIPYTLNGLTPEKIYKAKVRAYGSDGQSRWTNNISFLPSAKRHIGSSSGTEYNLPTATYNSFSLTEQIYTAAELGSAGIFTSIDFYNVANACTRNLDIYMAYTDKNSFDGSYGWVSVTEADKVFSGNVTFVKGAWTTIELDHLFSYDGQQNVVIAVDDNTGSSLGSNGTSPAQFSVFSISTCMSLGSHGNNFDITKLSEQYGSTYYRKNEIRLGVAEEGEVLRPGFLTCTEVTGSTATLSWTENGTATAWQLCLNDNENDLIDVTTNPYILTDLSPDVVYTAKVRAVSGNKFSEWSRNVSFEPTSKRRIGTGSGTNNFLPTFTKSSYSLSEQIYTAAEMGSAGIISSIDFFSTSSPCTRNLDIYMVHTDKNCFEDKDDWIRVTADDKVFSGDVTFSKNIWTTIDFDEFFNYNGEKNVMIVIDDNTGSYDNNSNPPNDFYVFDVNECQSTYYYYGNVDPTNPNCYGNPQKRKNQIRLGYATGSSVPRPKDLVCKDFTFNTATLSWTESGEATSWQICLNNDEYNLIDADTNTFTIASLAPGTYTAKVRAVSGNEVSDWSKSVSFGPLGKIRIGTGTYTQYNMPSMTSSPYSLTEQIYTSEEIGDAGAGAGVITSIDFYNTAPEQTRNLDIYLVHTDKSCFNHPSEFVGVNEADLVFSGNVTFLQDDWTVINFDKDFSYDGKSNVAIVVDDNTGSSFPGEPIRCYALQTYDYQLVYMSGGNNYDPAKPSGGGMMPYKNQIRLGFTPSIISIIARPTELACTGYTTTEATLSWTENGSATTWEICLNDDDEHPITANTNPYTLTGLTEETPYTAKVRAVANGEGSYWSSKVSFQPSDKLRIGTGEAANNYLPISSTSNYCMSEQIYTASDIGMAGTITSLDFFNKGKEFSRNLDIYIVYTDKSNFDDYKGVGATEADLVFSGNVTFNEGVWSTIYLDSPFVYDGQRNVVLIVDDNTSNSSGSTYYFYTYDAGANQALHYNDGTNLDPTSSEILERYGSRYSVKNQLRLGITTGTIATIPRPNALTCTDDSPTTATLSWTERGNATKWQICVNDDEENLITVTSNPYTLTGLTEEVLYTAKVRAVTADDGVSRWSEKVKFYPSAKINIGCGTYTDYHLPCFLNSVYSMSQQIYTAAEIGTAGTISSIDFYNAGSERSRNLDIYLVSSNKNNFESGSDWISVTAADKVFSGEIIFAQDAWTPIVLNTSYVYDGQSNVVLVVDDNTEETSYWLDFETFDAPGQALLFNNTYDNNINFDPTDPGSNSGTVMNMKNHIRLGITQPAVAGDVNGDGSVTIKDAIAVANYILTNGYPTGNFVFSAADMNGDKAITISDAVAIVNKILTGKE